MADIAIAQNLLHEAFPIREGRNVKRAIGEAFDAAKRLERSLSREALNDRPRRWTERRIRSLWEGNARRVDHFEISDLERVHLEQARAEYRKAEADLRRLEAVLTAKDEGELGAAQD